MAIRYNTPQDLVYWPHDIATISQLSTVSTATLIDATTEKGAWILPVLRTGNIVKVHFKIGSVGASAGGSYGLNIQTVDDSVIPSRPSGTMWGTSTSGYDVVANSETTLARSVTLVSAAQVVEGQHIAIVYEAVAVSSPNLVVHRISTGAISSPHFSAITAASTWAVPHTGYHIIAVEYDDGYIPPYPGCYPANTTTHETFTSASHDERGNRFKFPGSGRIWGAHLAIDPDATDLASLRLYNENDVLITSAAISRRNRSSNSNGVSFYKFPDSMPAYYQANKPWKCVVHSGSGAATSLTTWTALSSACMQALWGGAEMVYCTRTTGFGTSGFAETSDKKALIGLVFDLFEEGNSYKGKSLGRGLA